MQSNYLYLIDVFPHLITIAKLYKIDLSEANIKQKDGDKFGSQPNDINLDIAGSIHAFLFGRKSFAETDLKRYVKRQLLDWDYDLDEIITAMGKVEVLKN